MNACRCKGRGAVWCWLDWLTRCKIRPVCDRHDEWIVGE